MSSIKVIVNYPLKSRLLSYAVGSKLLVHLISLKALKKYFMKYYQRNNLIGIFLDNIFTFFICGQRFILILIILKYVKLSRNKSTILFKGFVTDVLSTKCIFSQCPSSNFWKCTQNFKQLKNILKPLQMII